MQILRNEYFDVYFKLIYVASEIAVTYSLKKNTHGDYNVCKIHDMQIVPHIPMSVILRPTIAGIALILCIAITVLAKSVWVCHLR